MKVINEMEEETPPRIGVPYARFAEALRFAWQKGQDPFGYCGGWQ